MNCVAARRGRDGARPSRSAETPYTTREQAADATPSSRRRMPSSGLRHSSCTGYRWGIRCGCRPPCFFVFPAMGGSDPQIHRSDQDHSARSASPAESDWGVGIRPLEFRRSLRRCSGRVPSAATGRRTARRSLRSDSGQAPRAATESDCGVGVHPYCMSTPLVAKPTPPSCIGSYPSTTTPCRRTHGHATQAPGVAYRLPGLLHRAFDDNGSLDR